MKASFDPSLPPGQAVRRTAQAQIAEAIVAAEEAQRSGDVGPAIHTVRKQSKRQRALLRLIRPVLPEDEWSRRRIGWRDLGRQLSGARDADVLARTAESLTEPSDELPEPYVRPILGELSSRGQAALELVRSAPDPLADVLRALGEQSRAADGYVLATLNWETLLGEAARSYDRGRAAFKRAAAKGKPSDFHEVRKRTKDLGYQAEMLRDAWDPGIRGIRKGAKQLSSRLGRLQDLNVLRRALDDGRGTEWNEDGADALLGRIATEIDRCRVEAVALGGRVYAEKPKAFRRRMLSYTPIVGTTHQGRVDRPVTLADVSA